MDSGDFADAVFPGSGAPVAGGEAVEKMLGDIVILSEDGTPRTRHPTTRIAVEADEVLPARSRTDAACARTRPAHSHSC
ncbi:hypothetical protein [Streptomyces sp. SCL15-4]|uniref:hypothetical protein n=1 Tax=Streptomyces sp. SCL15-4 TaxID=2967221 RepID=UPI002966B9AE|nr:hypothetical protein [Streptomyces sp. SCL15-4]